MVGLDSNAGLINTPTDGCSQQAPTWPADDAFLLHAVGIGSGQGGSAKQVLNHVLRTLIALTYEKKSDSRRPRKHINQPILHITSVPSL